MNESGKRYIGLDVHKHYLIALGVDEDLNIVLPARRVELSYLEPWMKKTLTKQDEVVLEMTTNTWQLYDELVAYAGSVLVVHPPHVALITRSQVMNDKIAASILARLLAKGLLVGIWVPPQEVRELRGLVAQRKKMTNLATQAKNRLHAVLQRHHLVPPEGNPFGESNKEWWQSLPIGKLEKINLQSDLETLQFAERQVKRMTEIMEGMAAEQEPIGRLLHLAGFGVVTAVTVWAAIGDIRRFAEPRYLVGYAGLGTRVHDSGMTTRTGKITKAGRRDLRTVLIESAQVVANSHPHWKAEFARLEPRLGHNKAIVAIARKLLVAVWYILSQNRTDRFAQPEAIAQKLLGFAYRVGKENRPAGQTAAQFVRVRLDALHLGSELTHIPWGSKKPIPLPPSSLTTQRSDVPNTT
ncbi:MAG TPA: IS110 family transposase [Anaerolineales bacterium]|nr:IS110 family transposase [Anaerolineales bacterium]